MKFFHNPKRKRAAGTRKARKATKRRATAKRGTGGRFVKASTKRRATTARRTITAATRKRRTTRSKGATMAKRRKSVRRAAGRRRRSTAGAIKLTRVRGSIYKRNPGVVAVLTRGVKDAAVAVAGKTAARFIGAKLPAFVPGQAGQIVNALISAAVVGMVGQRFGGADLGRLLVQGALQAPIETALQPVLSGIGLSSYPVRGRLASYAPNMLSGYPAPATPALASYPMNMSAAY